MAWRGQAVDHVRWPAKFEAVVRAHLPAPPPAGRLDPDLDLLAAGMDSLETIGLMTDLEDGFGFEFPDELLSIDTFSTPRILWAAMSSCLPADPSNAD
jgi:acyl carrier protein